MNMINELEIEKINLMQKFRDSP